MPDLPDLRPIIRAARAGARDYAWRLFRAAGLDGLEAPAALALKGRLLKDDARLRQGAAQRATWLEAAGAYYRAYELEADPYPLINAASLARLAGEAGRAAALAQAVLDMPANPKETDYYKAATPAEALLVLGRMDEARTRLTEAVALAPRAWEDHASTIRQFELLLRAMGEDMAWLDPLRPARMLHFAGAGGVVAADEAALRRQIDEALADSGAGFGYGAPLGPVDLMVAEAVLAAGADLHLVLPGALSEARTDFVARWGEAWAGRFDALTQAAGSVRELGGLNRPGQALSRRLAVETAMGLAAMRAGPYATRAVQLAVLDGDASDAPASAAWAHAVWTAARPDGAIVLHAPQAMASGAAASDDEPLRLAAVLSAAFAPAAPAATARDVLPALERLLAARPDPVTPPRWMDGRFQVAFVSPPEALALAQALVEAFGEGVQVGAHYGVVREAKHPFDGGPLLLGPPAEAPRRMAEAALPGAVQVGLTFAAALHAAGPAPGVNELPELSPYDDWTLAQYALG